jgi:hypothetical protein
MTCEASKNESVKILMSMTGIDYFSAMIIASEIGDITRANDGDNAKVSLGRIGCNNDRNITGKSNTANDVRFVAVVIA